MRTFSVFSVRSLGFLRPFLTQFLLFLFLISVAFVSNAQQDTTEMKAPPPKEVQGPMVVQETKDHKTSRAGTDSSYYVEPGSYGTQRIPTPPDYVRTLNNTGIGGVEKIDWLDVGLDHRTRYEYRQDDIRRSRLTTDNPFLFKTRAYIGIKNIIDPFRFAVEFQNSARLNSKFPKKGDDRDYNYYEPISLYGELHFKKLLGKDPLGNNRPVFIRFGRQNFEFLDRRLIGANQWRNTTNTFNGFRAGLGQDKNDWSVDLLAVHPLVRLIEKLDSTDFSRDFGAVIGHWRRWSEYITIEPYGLYLRQRPKALNLNSSRRIYNAGLRIYGWLNKSVNYDIAYDQQFGDDNGLTQHAYAITAELGYKFQYGWKPRFSLFYGYASGDRNPNDKVNNRFERFFGFARPWSADDYIVMENVVASKARIEFEPNKVFKVDACYSFYWLASATDRFNNFLNVQPNPKSKYNRNKDGTSGTYLGHGPDCRVRFTVLKFIATAVGYSHYFNGTFVFKQQDAAFGRHDSGSNFLYVETTMNIFDIFKKW